MKKAIIYARISTNKEKQNITQQIEYCKTYAKREGYNVIKVFKDEQTGKTDKRKGYQRLLKYLKENTKSNLIVQDTDRLTRDYYDGVELEKFILANQVNLISLSENIDLTTSNGRFMFRIKLAMNNFYVENLQDKIKVGVERAKKEGKFTGRKKGAKNRHLSKSKTFKQSNDYNKVSKMTTQERQHKKTILQYHSNRYTLTIPKWIVKKVLCAEHGSVIKFDFRGNQVLLQKEDNGK